MGAAGQLDPLSRVFRDMYLRRRPRRLAILGCATGNGMEHIDPSITQEVVGIDINASYLDVARKRATGKDVKLTLIEADIMQFEFEPASLDFVHAALVLEYVEPSVVVPRMARWLSPEGSCAVILQLPSARVPAVTTTQFTSLKALNDIMHLHDPGAIERLATGAGLKRASAWEILLPNEKKFWVGVFEKM